MSAWQVSERRACRVMQANRSTQHYKSVRSDQADLKKRIKEIAETRVRYGYRRIHVLLKREGWLVNEPRNDGSKQSYAMTGRMQQLSTRPGRWILFTISS